MEKSSENLFPVHPPVVVFVTCRLDPLTGLLSHAFSFPVRGAILGSGCQSVRMLVALGFANM